MQIDHRTLEQVSQEVLLRVATSTTKEDPDNNRTRMKFLHRIIEVL